MALQIPAIASIDANERRIDYCEKCFGSAGMPLKKPGRILIGEGVLTKVCRKKPKLRQFFLFNDILVYGSIIISKKQFGQQRIIHLDEVKIHCVSSNHEGYENGFAIITPTKSFTVYAATATEGSEWQKQISKYVHECQKGRYTHLHTLSDDSPVWVPDQDAAVCMHCKRSEFTFINRRHHCRKCGHVVCNSCSTNRFVLPNQSSRPRRVCLTCYKKLCEAAAGDSGSIGDFISNFPSCVTLRKENPQNDEDSSSSGEEEEEQVVLRRSVQKF